MSKEVDDEAGAPFWATSLAGIGELPTKGADPKVDEEDDSEHKPAIEVITEPEGGEVKPDVVVPPVTPPVTETPTDYVVSFLDEVDGILEEDGLLVDTGKTYSPDAKGVAEMLKDTIAARDAAWETKMKEALEAERDALTQGDVLKAEDMDVTNDDHAKTLLVKFYRNNDWEDDEIEEKLQTLAELGDLAKEAEKAKRVIVKLEKAEAEARIEERKRAEQEEQKYIDDYVSGVKSDIDKAEELAGFKLDKKTREGFKSYLFDVEKDGKTKAQKAAENQDHRITVAFMDYMNFSKKDFEIKARTELAIAQDKKNSRYSTVGQEVRAVNRREKEDPGLSNTLNSIGIFNGSGDIE